MHDFKKGEHVWIINSTLGGRLLVEGQAVILKPIKGMENQYRVRFMEGGEPILGEEYERFVDPQAQRDPSAFVDQLNRLRERIDKIA